jgi:hemolysin activation/secretion protein
MTAEMSSSPSDDQATSFEPVIAGARGWGIGTLAVLLGMAFPALAMTPDENAVQELLRQQERERALRKQQERRPDVRLGAGGEERAAEWLPEGETPCVAIDRITLDDESGRFAWAVAAADLPDPVSGRCLGSRGINRVMARIQNAIIDRGYVTTRIFAGAQDLNSGVLVLKVLPGRLRAIRFSDDSGLRANAWNAFPAASGDILNLHDIEQALENWKRVPTVETDIQIVPGETPGTSDLVVVWKQAFPLRLTLSANDGGSETTGKYQGSVTVSGDHLLALNDLFYASFSSDLGGGKSGERGTRGHTVHYSLPFGYWSASLTRSANRYHQTVAGASQDYLYSGLSENHEIRLSRLVHRDSANKTTVSLRGYLVRSRNFVDDTEIEVQRRRMAGWELGVGYRAFIAQAVLDLDLAWRRGTGAFTAQKAPEEAFGEGTARPRILRAEATLSWPFRLGGQRMRYQGAWQAQWNRTPLVPQDRFSIGGRYTVRGFDGESVLMAERGFLLRNDVFMALGDSRQEAYLGVDHGQIGGPSADLLVGRRLTGAVVGLHGSWKKLGYDIFAGWPVSQPRGFRSDPNTVGFHLTASF